MCNLQFCGTIQGQWSHIHAFLLEGEADATAWRPLLSFPHCAFLLKRVENGTWGYENPDVPRVLATAKEREAVKVANNRSEWRRCTESGDVARFVNQTLEWNASRSSQSSWR